MKKAILISLELEIYQYLKENHIKISSMINEILKEKWPQAYE